MKTMDLNFDGDVMKNITNCIKKDILTARNIFIVMYVSFEYSSDHLFDVESVKMYSKLHGYNLKIVDPSVVFKEYGKLPSDSTNNAKGEIVSSKLLIIQCKIKIFK